MPSTNTHQLSLKKTSYAQQNQTILNLFLSCLFIVLTQAKAFQHSTFTFRKVWIPNTSLGYTSNSNIEQKDVFGWVFRNRNLPTPPERQLQNLFNPWLTNHLDTEYGNLKGIYRWNLQTLPNRRRKSTHTSKIYTPSHPPSHSTQTSPTPSSHPPRPPSSPPPASGPSPSPSSFYHLQ